MKRDGSNIGKLGEGTEFWIERDQVKSFRVTQVFNRSERGSHTENEKFREAGENKKRISNSKGLQGALRKLAAGSDVGITAPGIVIVQMRT